MSGARRPTTPGAVREQNLEEEKTEEGTASSEG
jgi:hypothetical protein